MRCPEVRQKLDLYACEELAPSAREKIEAHLSDCTACRQELARLRRLENLLAAAPLPPVPEGFAEQVVARARCEASPARGQVPSPRRLHERLRRRVRTIAGTAAALAAGLLLGCFLGLDTWQSDARSAAADPLSGSGLGQFVEPGGESLAQTYLDLTTGSDG